MTIKLNLGRLDYDLAVPGIEPEAHAPDTSLYGAIASQIVISRLVLQIGDACGAVVREASRADRAYIRPRPTPILLRPSLIRGFLDRRVELAGALAALDAGLPIEASGDHGVGKTALLRHLAHHARAASFVDGILYVPARHQSSIDLLQLIFEAFYESDEICKPTETEVRRALQEKQALILLDDVHLTQGELEQVLDIAPRSAFVVATRERRFWGEVRSVPLKGLPAEDSVLLLEREIERSLDPPERAAAASLCEAIGGTPLRILQAAAIIREQGLSLHEWAPEITPEGLVTELLASIDEKQRRLLLTLAALPGVPLEVQHVSGIAELTDIEPSLLTLVRRGLVVSSQSRHQLADGIGDRLRRTEDLKPWLNRAITYFTAWAERYRRNASKLLEESETLLRVQQHAADTRRWGEVQRLGQLLEGALIIGARWGAWAAALERCLAAAKATGDRSAEAWVLHEMGSRAVCLGEPRMARALLSEAVKLREALGEEAGAAASRRNLTFVAAPVPDEPPAPAKVPLEDVVAFESLQPRDDTQLPIPVRRKRHAGAVVLTALLGVILGAFAYLAISGGLSENVDSIGSFFQGGVEDGTGGASATARARLAAGPQVLQFSAVPDRVAPGQPVRLCYEVADGTRVRIDPDIGELGTLARNCVSTTPIESTIYMLTATGSKGEAVRQTLLVPVGVAASRPLQPEEPPAVLVRPRAKALAVDLPVVPQAPAAPVAERASILIFTPRPGSIATGGPTYLCYAVSAALQARLEPGIGDVNPTSRLTCLRVTPVRTTTYELTANGRDGYQVRQQLVIVVR